MAPVIAEVIHVGEFVADPGQYLVEAHLFLGHPGLALSPPWNGHRVLSGLRIVLVGAESELVQMRIGPAERPLDNTVHLVEEQV